MNSTIESNDIVIRRAKPQDSSQVYNLMIELAVFLKCDREMTLSSEHQSTIVGYSLYFHIYNFLEGFGISMENLYVSKSHRGMGIGKMLWQEVTRIGLELGSTGILIIVDNWNKASKDWYTRRGCVDLTETKEYHYLTLGRKEMEAFVNDA
ncbi:hypothetical protein EGW08_015272 [Elysia chlorotica]|uniref:N-acetyltransferase domain-containing protein n=1 Tax=Elysia chlorotica TaxID=188477 RepID=A0A3S1B0H9_ELYCH|nr:hypothetical protein EGW08_015272 [Elysia chlorotica]